MLSALTVNRNEVLETVRHNLTMHVAQFEKAQSGYSLALGHELTRLAKVASREAEAVAAGKEPKWNLIVFDTGLQRPVSHEADYQCAIRMLELSVDDRLHLDAQQFNTFIMDNWSWKPAFFASAGTYARYSDSSQFWIRS